MIRTSETKIYNFKVVVEPDGDFDMGPGNRLEHFIGRSEGTAGTSRTSLKTSVQTSVQMGAKLAF